jgi:hypothetical protein
MLQDRVKRRRRSDVPADQRRRVSGS